MKLLRIVFLTGVLVVLVTWATLRRVKVNAAPVAEPLAVQITKMPFFEAPLVWAGTLTPPEHESAELYLALSTSGFNLTNVVFEELEAFLDRYPNSA